MYTSTHKHHTHTYTQRSQGILTEPSVCCHLGSLQQLSVTVSLAWEGEWEWMLCHLLDAKTRATATPQDEGPRSLIQQSHVTVSHSSARHYLGVGIRMIQGELGSFQLEMKPPTSSPPASHKHTETHTHTHTHRHTHTHCLLML